MALNYHFSTLWDQFVHQSIKHAQTPSQPTIKINPCSNAPVVSPIPIFMEASVLINVQLILLPMLTTIATVVKVVL